MNVLEKEIQEKQEAEKENANEVKKKKEKRIEIKKMANTRENYVKDIQIKEKELQKAQKIVNDGREVTIDTKIMEESSKNHFAQIRRFLTSLDKTNEILQKKFVLSQERSIVEPLKTDCKFDFLNLFNFFQFNLNFTFFQITTIIINIKKWFLRRKLVLLAGKIP